MPKIKVDYFELFQSIDEKEFKAVKSVTEYDKFIDGEVKDFMLEKLTDVFDDFESLKIRAVKSPSEAKDYITYSDSNLRMKQLVEITLGGEMKVLELATFKNREDFNERFLHSVAELFD